MSVKHRLSAKMFHKRKRGNPVPPSTERATSVQLLWRERNRTRPGRKPGVTLEEIVRAAISIADAEGLSAISMQRVAAKLDFTTMALYRYLPGKAELIDLMIDTALGPPPALTESKRNWRLLLEEWARLISVAFYKHPWALEATGRLRPTGPNELGWMEAAVSAICETGLNGADQLDVLQAIMGQVRIEVQYSATFPVAEQRLSAKQWQFGISTLLEKHGARYPSLKGCLDSSSSFAEPQDELKLGLRCVLDGIGRLIEKSRRQRR